MCADTDDTQLRCYTCQSIYHMAQQCPEKYDTYYTQEPVLWKSDRNHPDNVKNLVSETWNAPVLDSGATNTVADKILFNCFIDSLNIEEKLKTQHHIWTLIIDSVMEI